MRCDAQIPGIRKDGRKTVKKTRYKGTRCTLSERRGTSSSSTLDLSGLGR